MLYGRWVPAEISRCLCHDQPGAKQYNAPMAGNPPHSLPGTHHTQLTVETGKGGRWQKDVDELTKDVQETAQSYDQNVPGSTMLEHACTIAKCTEPQIQ